VFKNFIRAKVSTHGLMVAFTMFAFAAHRFFSDPNAAEWLRRHWVLKDLFETAGATLIAFGIYQQPSKSSE
jgi:hypothetical protein